MYLQCSVHRKHTVPMLMSSPSGVTLFLGRICPPLVLVTRAVSGLTRVFGIISCVFLNFYNLVGFFLGVKRPGREGNHEPSGD